MRFYYVFPLIMATLIAFGLFLSAWRKQHSPGARPFAVMMLAVAVWSLMSILTHWVNGETAKVWWTNMQYWGVVVVPPTWLAFALAYTKHENVFTFRQPRWLWIHPTLTLLLVWTNPWHHWFRQATWLTTDAGFPLLGTTMGPAFWLHAAYSYLLLFIGTVVLVRTYWNGSPLYRQQTQVLVAGALLPWVANSVYIFDLNPLPALDITPFAFVLAGALFAVGMWRFRFSDLIPIARDTVIENLADGVMVLDLQKRVIDMNPAAQRLLGFSLQDSLGNTAESILELTFECDDHPPNYDTLQKEITWVNEGITRIYDWRVSALLDYGGQRKGYIMEFRDITKRKRADLALLERGEALRRYAEELEAQNAELDAFAHTVAHDLKGPLGILLGYSSMLEFTRANLANDTIYNAVRAVSQNVRKMANIIDELLLLASVRQMEDVPIMPLAMGVIVEEALRRLKDEIANGL